MGFQTPFHYFHVLGNRNVYLVKSFFTTIIVHVVPPMQLDYWASYCWDSIPGLSYYLGLWAPFPISWSNNTAENLCCDFRGWKAYDAYHDAICWAIITIRSLPSRRKTTTVCCCWLQLNFLSLLILPRRLYYLYHTVAVQSASTDHYDTITKPDCRFLID